MLRRLDRYFLTEILGPLALGFVIYTFILLLRTLFRSAELIIRSGVEPAVVGRLLLLSLPNIVVLTIPMAFLFAILIAVGRLSADSELVAIRASGVSLFSLYRPIFILSAVLTIVNIYLMVDVLPNGNHALQELRLQIVNQGINEEIEPRVPQTGWEDRMLYVFEAPVGERRWRGTFLADSIPSQQSRIDIAEWGSARATPDGSQVVLRLENAFTHRFDMAQPDRYEIIAHSEIELNLTSDRQQAMSSVRRSLRELSLRELRSQAVDPTESELTRNLALVEIHKKLSIPVACLVFGLLGLPLGFNNSRGGRSSGFAISIGVILIYYVLLSFGEDFAKKGTAPPWLTIWAPNIALLVIGLFLLARRNRDKSLLLADVDRWIQQHLWGGILRFRVRRENRRRAAHERAMQEARRQRRLDRHGEGDRANLILRLPSLHLRFPNSIDRYVLAIFFRVLAISILGGVTIYIVADLTEVADEILRNQPPREVIFHYYRLKSLSILYEIAPIIVLVTTLVSFGLLSRTNEITALKALGMSLYRLAFPVVLAGVLIAGLCGLLQAEVLSASSRRTAELEAIIRGKATPLLHQRADRRWLYGQKGGYLYNYAGYDPETQEMRRLQVFKFDDHYRLTDRLFVQKATYAGEGWWTFSEGWAWTFDGTRIVEFRPFDAPRKEQLPEPPEFFQGELRKPEEMHYTELRDYIADLEEIGQESPVLEVELHNKIAYPVISLVMALVALPFAFKLDRRQGGALYGIGLSLLLGIVLMVFLAIFSALGEAGILSPLLAVWSPNLIFAIFSLYLFLGIRT